MAHLTPALSPLRRAKAALQPYAARAHRFLYETAAETWDGRPLDWYRRVRDLSRPSLARARTLLRRLRATPPAPPAFAPPPAFAILPRRGDSVEPEIMRAHIRAAIASVAPSLTPTEAHALLAYLRDVAEPASTLLSAELLARSGEAERGLGRLLGVEIASTLSDMGLSALAPLGEERRHSYRAQAAQALSAGRAARASEQFRMALALDPNAEDLRLGLAQALAAQGRDAEARLVLQRLLERNPNHHAAAALRADLLED
ncbi:MAG: tetratricopeptide repeat protein [Pseudomonadota bacterium]